jgi:hypothetical protein
MSARARSKLWQEAIASNKDVERSAGYPATPDRHWLGSIETPARSGNRHGAEAGYDLSALLTLTLSRCLDTVCSLSPPLV